jgi:hypothetical protein
MDIGPLQSILSKKSHKRKFVRNNNNTEKTCLQTDDNNNTEKTCLQTDDNNNTEKTCLDR